MYNLPGRTSWVCLCPCQREVWLPDRQHKYQLSYYKSTVKLLQVYDVGSKIVILQLCTTIVKCFTWGLNFSWNLSVSNPFFSIYCKYLYKFLVLFCCLNLIEYRNSILIVTNLVSTTFYANKYQGNYTKSPIWNDMILCNDHLHQHLNSRQGWGVQQVNIILHCLLLCFTLTLSWPWEGLGVGHDLCLEPSPSPPEHKHQAYTPHQQTAH